MSCSHSKKTYTSCIPGKYGSVGGWMGNLCWYVLLCCCAAVHGGWVACWWVMGYYVGGRMRWWVGA